MLKPRPLNSPATRERTPNLFSTVTEMMCSMQFYVCLTGVDGVETLSSSDFQPPRYRYSTVLS